MRDALHLMIKQFTLFVTNVNLAKQFFYIKEDNENLKYSE